MDIFKYKPPYEEPINEDGAKPPFPVFGTEKKKLNKKETMEAHLKQNSTLFNTMFFNADYADQAIKLHGYEYLNHFYPSFKIHNLTTRMASSIGGLACHEIDVEKEYNPKVNWYKIPYKDDAHIRYCILLYNTVDLILQGNPPKDFDDTLSKWESMIFDHYEKMKSYKEYSTAYFKEAQALHDLLWDPLDNPNDPDVKAANIISFLKLIPSNGDETLLTPLSEVSSGEMVRKEDVQKWINKQLDPDTVKSFFLLPEKEKYLVIDADSVRYAMDAIGNVPIEDRKEYASNLNRFYWKFHPDISISADHPYAKYLGVGPYKIPPEKVIVPILTGMTDVIYDKNKTYMRQLPPNYIITEAFFYADEN